jgi:hypothetical protein
MATAPTPEQLANAAKLVESGDAYNKVLKETQKIQDEIDASKAAARSSAAENLINERAKADALAKQKDQQTEITKALREQRNIEDKIALLQDQTIGLDGAHLQYLIDQLDVQRGALATNRNTLATAQDAKKVQTERLADLAKEEKVQKKLQKDEADALKKMTKLQEQYGDAVKDNIAAAEAGNERLDVAVLKVAKKIPGGLGGAIGKVMDAKTKTLDFATDIGKIGTEMGDKFGSLGPKLQSASKGIGEFAKGLGAGNIAAIAFLAIAAKMALDISNLSKELGAATGFGDQFNTEIRRMGASGAMMGIEFKDAAEALGAMADGLSSFNPAAEATNTYVGMTVAKLQKLGVSSAASVKSIDHMQRAMGLSAEKAADLTAQIARMGKEIGITGTKMINDFNAASGRLAIYGNQNTKVFKQLAAQAKATGIEMNSLLTISKNFDTFDSAADHAAQLNAVLGTQLSTIEMMNATDSERIMILKQEVQASVGNFDSLDKFTKQYIQQAMGVASVDEAQRLLNMSTAEYQEYQDGQKESADVQAEMAAAVASTVPVMDQLKMAGIQLFMAFEPLIMGFTAIIKAVSWLFTGLAEMTGGMGEASKVGTVFKAVLTGIAIGLMVFFGPVSATVGIVMAVVAAIGALYDILHKPGSKSIAGGIFGDIGNSVGGFGAAIKLLFLPLTLVVGAISKLWDILHLKGSSDMANGLFTDIGKDVDFMTGLLQLAGFTVQAVAKSFTKMWEAVHSKPGDSIDVTAMANIDTSKVAAGWNEIKSAVMELSNIKMDGFLAMKTDGTSSSFVMGSDGLIKSISEGKLVVDVKMPEMKMPDVSVKVYIGNKELKEIIRTEVKAVVGRAG